MTPCPDCRRAPCDCGVPLDENAATWRKRSPDKPGRWEMDWGDGRVFVREFDDADLRILADAWPAHPGARCRDIDAALRGQNDALDELLDAIGDRPIRFWTCPLHPAPTRLMTTVEWRGNDAVCLLCGFTRAEHKTRALRAKAAEVTP